MKYVNLNDDIAVLQFSVRTVNCLRKTNVNTIEELLSYPRDEFANIKSMGNKSVKEIFDFIDSIVNNNGEYITVDPNEKQKKTFLGDDGYRYEDIEINTDILTVRAVNALNNEGYNYVSEILSLTFDDLLHIRNMGRKTAELIYDYIINVEFDRVESEDVSELESQCRVISSEIAKYFCISNKDVLSAVKETLKLYPNAKAESLINAIYSHDLIKSKVKDFLVAFIKDKGMVTQSELYSLMPSNTHNTLVLDQILIELELDRVLTIADDRIKANYISVIDYINLVYSDRNKDILLSRINGKTLDEIGSNYNITRERIRQIIDKELKKFPKTREEEYLYYVKNYDFSLNDFVFVFDEPETTFHYLINYLAATDKKKKDKKPLDDALLDDYINENVKRKIERAVYKKYVLINGVWIKKRTPELVKYYVRTTCTEETCFDDFKNGFEKFLSENDLDERLMIESRTYENHFANCNYVLWHAGKTFRYYNIEAIDIDEFLEELNLEQYKDLDMSTLKIYRDNEKLMKQLDIRDEKELHNLLKKIVQIKGIDNIKFGRMPSITFGKGDRNKQIYDLLIQHAPISMYKLGDICEEMYGYLSRTAVATCFKCISQYCHNGMFRIDEKAMPNSMLETFKQRLINDYYPIDQIKALFKDVFPDEDVNLINTVNLKSLGFKVYSGYVISNRFSSASEYFDGLLLSDDIVDIRNIEKKASRSSLYAYISDIKRTRKVVEFEPNKFINIRRLNNNGVTVDDIDNYCDCAASLINKGEFFTIKSLRNKGFAHKLDDLGFDDYFYTSLLIEDERFSFRRMGNTKLLYYGNKTIQMLDLLKTVLDEIKKIDIYDLVDYLYDEYGIKTNRDDIKQLVRESDMYYDQIMDAVYVDYNTYFEEV